jgi:hypothetical protein
MADQPSYTLAVKAKRNPERDNPPDELATAHARSLV